MTEIHVGAWVPVRKPLRLPGLNIPEDFYDCLKEFCNSLPEVLLRLYSFVLRAEAQITEPSKAVVNDLQLINRARWLNAQSFEFIQIDCLMEYDREAFQSINDEHEISGSFLSSWAACDLATIVVDALILAQLAYPTRINTLAGHAYVGHHKMNEIREVSGISNETVLDPSITWPKIQIIPIKRVSEWEAKIGLFKQDIARDTIQRALASFTHLVALSSISTGEALFWSMQGLEAFYCSGQGDLRRQLADKSRLFLGPWEAMSNIVGHLYDLRSKFVHGDFNLERWNNYLEPSTEDLNDQSKLASAMLLASRMLLSTLQKCADECISSVEFDYSLKVEHV